MSRIYTFILVALFALMAVSIVFLTLWLITNLFVPEPCKINTDFCLELRALKADKATLFVGLLGVSLSLVGTVALVLTIVLSSRSTDAATEALIHARNVSTIELRPYVHFLYPQIVNVVDPATNYLVGYAVRIHYKNSGVSFAANVRGNANYWIGEGEIPNYFTYPSADQREAAGSIIGDRAVFSQTPDISVMEMETVLARRCCLHVWCWVEYSGTVSNEVYRSEFHARLNVWRDMAGNIEMDYFFHPTFNGVDALSFRPPKS